MSHSNDNWFKCTHIIIVLIFGLETLRTWDPSDLRTFGIENLRTWGPSELRTFGIVGSPHTRCSRTLQIRTFFKRYTRSDYNNLMIINDFVDVLWWNITTEIKKCKSIDILTRISLIKIASQHRDACLWWHHNTNLFKLPNIDCNINIIYMNVQSKHCFNWSLYLTATNFIITNIQ